MSDDTRSFVITRRDGSEHTVLLDAADYSRAMEFWPTWCLTSKGYVYCAKVGHPVYLHRFVMGFGPRDPRVDHINGDPLDNRRVNLRPATNAANVAHQKIVNGRGTSRFRGVHRRADTGRWAASQRVNYRTVTLGCFDSQEEAATVVARFRAEHGLPPGY